MKLRILAIAAAGWFGGALHASTVVSCGWSPTAINSCVTGGLTNFVTQLDWAAFGTDGSIHNGLWTQNLTNGMTVTVSTQNANIAGGEGARTAVNLGSVYYNSQWWDYQSSPVYVGAPFVGHFNAPSTPYSLVSSDIFSPGIPGDKLMGLAGNGVGTSKALVIDFGQSLSFFAFRIAAVNLSSFNVTLTTYAGANGTGSVLGTFNLNGLTGGGTCPGVRPGNFNVPTPCNDAQLIAAMGALNTRSIAIQTNDPSGFYIGDIYMAPEPSPFIFAGCGLALLIIGKKKFGRV